MRYVTDEIINEIKELQTVGDYAAIAKLYAATKKTNNPLTPERIDAIKHLHASGLSTRDIGRVLGISKTAAWGMVKD